MKNITVNQSKIILNKISQLIEKHDYRSRSEFIRVAIKSVLPRLMKLTEKFRKIDKSVWFADSSICTFNMPEHLIEVTDMLSNIDNGLFTSRSETIRVIMLLYFLLENEYTEEETKKDIEIDDPNTVKVPVDDTGKNGFKTFRIIQK